MEPNTRWTHFTDAEVEGLNEEFVAKLDKARHRAGIPFIITSGLRTPEKNQSIVGSVPESSHLVGKGADLLVENSHEVYRIIEAAIAVGINRIGIYVNADMQPIHVHLDVDTEGNHVPEVVFIRKEGVA